MKKLDIIFLSVILIIAFVLRMYNIGTPLADLHSWRQADTAAVARNFSRHGINLLKPQYDDISSIQSGLENPEGLRMVEFPIYNAIIAVFHRYLPITTITVYGRAISSFFSLLIISVIYYLALLEKNRLAAIAASTIYAVFPFFVFFSRLVLPETTAVAFMMLSLFFLYTATKKKQIQVAPMILSAVFLALSLLTKPTTIFYGLAVGFLFIDNLRFQLMKNWKPYVFALLTLAPFIWWRWYILYFPEAIPSNSWLLTHVNTFEGSKEIFFRPAFFRWIFMERIGVAILGIYGVFFLIMGLIIKTKRLFIPSIAASAFIYLMTFQGGNVQHEYYQTIILPAIALICGIGIAGIVEFPSKFIKKTVLYPTILIIFILSIAFSYYRVKDYYYYPKDLPQVAELIKTFTQPEDKIVTDRSGDTTLLYLADRKGAPGVYKDLNELKELGYTYFVTSNSGMKDRLKRENYVVLVENEIYMIVKL